MTNRVVFALVAKRAEEAQAKATSLASPVKFETAAGNILYAANRIKALEEQVEALTKISNDWKASAIQAIEELKSLQK